MNMNREEEKSWVDTTASAAPCLLAAAAGIFVGDMIQRKARGPVALALVFAGIAALTPAITSSVKKRVAGPNTRRGSLRTLRSIRDAEAGGQDFDVYEDDEVGMFVG